jgi:predicted esterase
MLPSPIVRTIEARTHGRYLVHLPPDPANAPLLVGFHGYAEDAQRHLDALQQIPGSDRWVLVAAQALHPFYTRDERIVANWMTKQDRDLAIPDNIRYVGAVIDAVKGEFGSRPPLVLVGFSQGGAMAYRAAVPCGADALIVLAADVPPEVADQRAQLPPVLLGRGIRDEWYTESKMVTDTAVLTALGTDVEECVFDGGHEWGEEFLEAAGTFLERLRNRE